MPIQRIADTGSKNVMNVLPVTKNGIVSMPGKVVMPTPAPAIKLPGNVKGPVATLPKPKNTISSNKSTTTKKTVVAPKNTNSTKEPTPQVKQGVVQKPNTDYKKTTPTSKTVTAPKNTTSKTVTAPKTITAPKTVTAPKSTTPKVTAPQTSKPAPKVTSLPTDSAFVKGLMQNWNLNNNRVDAMLTKGFNYNPEFDPSYQALEALAQKNAKVASRGAMEDMNDRGILNSTITSDRLGQIQQGAQDAVTAQIPTLQNAAYGRWSDKVNWYQGNAQNAFNNAGTIRAFEYGQGQDTINNGFRQDEIDIARTNSDYNGLGVLYDQVNQGQSEMPEIDTKAATNGAIAEMSGFKNEKDARDYYNKNSYRFATSGVQINSLLGALDKLYPGFSGKVKSSGFEYPTGN